MHRAPQGRHLIAGRRAGGAGSFRAARAHDGPCPASTNFGATRVGTLAIRRFLRPVCVQNMPAGLLPEDLRG
jgi:hypothetical protein